MPGVDFSESWPLAPEISTGDAVSLPDEEHSTAEPLNLASGLTRSWFLLRTKPSQEHRAVRSFAQWDAPVETLLPLMPAIRPVTKKHQPLFPGYLFTRFEPRWIPKAEITYGVLGLVRFGANLAVVEDSLIEEIRARLGPGGILTAAAGGGGPEIVYRRGDHVRVTSGPFKDRVGIFDCRLTARHRVQILLSSIAATVPGPGRRPPQSAHGFSARVKLGIGDLEKISA